MNNAIDSTDLEVRSDQYVCLEGNEPPKCPVTRCNDPTKCQACEGTGELDLDWVGSDPGILLGACQGDCNTDSDCDGDIKCYHDQIPPGCVGSMDAGQDYCGNPDFGIELKWHEWNPNFILGECEGDCDSDDECEADLICYHNEAPRECVGTMKTSNTDYCGRSNSPCSSAQSVSNPSIPVSVIPETPVLVFALSIKDWYEAHYYELGLFLVSLLVVLCVINVCVVMNRPRRKVKVYAPVKYMESDTESTVV